MDTDKKQIIEQVGRWLRIGTFAVTVLGPVINAVASRLRESKEEQTAQRRSETGPQQKSRAADHAQSEQNSAFWITLGFAVGLVGATIVVFQFVRKRIRRIDEEASLSLAWNASLYSGTLNKPAMEARPVNQQTPDSALQQSLQPQSWTETPIPPPTEQPGAAEQ